MPKDFNRTERIADLIHKALVIVLQKKITDPRLQFITITSVKVTKDLAFADILFTQLNLPYSQTKQSKEETEKLLKKAGSRLRYVLAQQLELRVMPRLRFFYDDLDVQKRRLHDLIDSAIAQDKAKPSK